MVDTQILSKVARVEPNTPPVFAVAWNRSGICRPHGTLPPILMLPVALDVPERSEDDESGQWLQYYYRAAKAKIYGTQFATVRVRGLKKRVAVRFLNWGVEDCIVFVVNDATANSDVAKLYQMVSEHLGEPHLIRKKGSDDDWVQVISVHAFPNEPILGRMRVCFAAMFDDDDDEEGIHPPRPTPSNAIMPRVPIAA